MKKKYHTSARNQTGIFWFRSTSTTIWHRGMESIEDLSQSLLELSYLETDSHTNTFLRTF